MNFLFYGGASNLKLPVSWHAQFEALKDLDYADMSDQQLMEMLFSQSSD